MGKFDFITDERLRASLEGDSAEVDACFQHGAWKGLHVLVGSIIEAILTDYLTSSGYKPPNNEDILKFDLGKLIDVCKNEGALTQKTKELSAVIKSYRNLIHPGRVVRLKEKVDPNSARVAQALLMIVLEEVSEHKREKYGYTAEQILSKVEKDPSSLSILTHLLKDTKEHEIERLVMTVLPARYLEVEAAENWPNESEEMLERFAASFRASFDAMGDPAKARVTRKFVSVVKEADQRTVLIYEDRFFRSSDLTHVPPVDAGMIKEHLLSRLAETRTVVSLRALGGIGPFLLLDDVSRILDPLLSEVAYGKMEKLRRVASELIVTLWQSTQAPVDAAIVSRLQDWKKHFEKKDLAEPLKAVEKLIEECDLPF